MNEPEALDSEARGSEPLAAGRSLPGQGEEVAQEARYTGGVHRLIEEQAARTPTRAALRLGDERLTYAELDQRANRLGRCLRASGVDPRTQVLICLDQSTPMVVALLAVWKVGAAAALVDASHSEAQLGRMVEEVKPAAMIVRGPQFRGTRAMGAPVIDLDGLLSAIASVSDQPLGIAADPQSLALHLVADGSPERMVASHLDLVRLLASAAGEAALRPAEVGSVSFPLWTAPGILELLLPLVIGIEVVVAGESTSEGF